VGGKATAANVALRCRAHNAYEAERYYGPGVREGAELVPERVGPDGQAWRRMATRNGDRTAQGVGRMELDKRRGEAPARSSPV